MTRQMLHAFAMVMAIAVPTWILWRLVLIASRGWKFSADREALLAVWFCYLTAVLAITIVPLPLARDAGEARLNLHPLVYTVRCFAPSNPAYRALRACTKNTFGNVILFMPFGLLLPFVWRRVRNMGIVIVLAVLFSLGIESTQYLERAFGTYRAVDVDDVLLNVLGAFLGALIGLPAVRRAARSRRYIHSS